MQRTRIVFLILLACFSVSSSYAQLQTLVIWLTHGEKVSYALTERPKTTFDRTSLQITTSTLEATYPLEKVEKYTYSDQATGIDETGDLAGPVVQQEGADYLFHHWPTGEMVRVYSVDGQLLDQYRVETDQLVRVKLSGYPTGVYVIQISETAYKVFKR